MSSKKKRKPSKSSHQSRLIKLQTMQSKKILSTHLSVFAASFGEGIYVYAKNGERQHITKVAADVFPRIQLKWSVTCYVMCRDNNGQDYLKSIVITLDEERSHKTIKSAISELHWNFLQNECNENHILTAGWIATKAGEEVSDDIAYKVFDDIGVWRECFAPWQDERAVVNG
ncbi:hypothetical protein P7F88_25175 [Vibrio hannami]|uniref:hypothetical protein n=1 Tax=Vibrio hannami TaxID=2717094 RepID=UPI002410A869|nr:hypothetical protein [Vibrio hannami]MDG3089157.1 hypothetical protein [Vibrio hannami]